MLIVISPEEDIENEITILHELFEAGLEYFHLRKPAKDEKGLRQWLNQVDSRYYNRIMMHSHFTLVSEFKLKGFHFQEKRRLNFADDLELTVSLLRKQGYAVSASFHDPEDIKSCTVYFDYHLLSPVFNSISKQGYEGKGFDVNHIDKTVIGMGGVEANNIKKLKTMGYKGVGVLGGIWNAPDPVASFKTIHNNL